MSEESKARVQQEFGANAAYYATSKVHAKGYSLQRLVEVLPLQADWRGLDVATAAGHTAFALAPHVAHVTATDLTPEMIPVAQQVAQEKGISNVTLETADAEALPYEDATFDVVTCRIAPHHFPNIAQFLAESARVLRQGGFLAVVDNVVPGSRLRGKKGKVAQKTADYINAFEKLRDPSHGRCWSLNAWLDGFHNVGLTVTHQETWQKEMAFYKWANRLHPDPELVLKLEVMLRQAPEPVLAFLTPEFTGDRILFYLSEAIIVGQKQ